MGICSMAKETQKASLHQPRGVGLRGRWKGSSKGMADSGWGMTENNKIL